MSNFKKNLQKFIKQLEKISFTRLSVKDQTLFAKRLSFLIRAGVPILESLHILREQTKSYGQTRIFEKIIGDVSNGQTLSRSLGKFPNVFGDFAINIIKVGESSGTLSQNLNYLADELKKKQTLRRKVVSALVYPAFITVATLGITGLLTVFIFPKILPIFASLKVNLPISTRIVIFISDFLSRYGLYIILGLFIIFIGSYFLLKRIKKFHLIFDWTILKLPIFGTMIQYYNLTNCSRTLGLLLKSGVILSEALPITADTTQNLVYKREFAVLGHAVNRGEKISRHLHSHKRLFPEILTHMVAVGERSGNLSETLVYLSELYENELEDITKNLSSLIEPILMIFMGLIVGFVAVSVITPIYEVTQHLQR